MIGGRLRLRSVGFHKAEGLQFAKRQRLIDQLIPIVGMTGNGDSEA